MKRTVLIIALIAVLAALSVAQDTGQTRAGQRQKNVARSAGQEFV